MHYTRNNIGALVHCGNLSHAPAANAAGTRDGAAFLFGTFRSCILVAVSGAVTGAPSAQGATYKMQSSPDGTTWSDVEDRDGNAVTVAVTAANSIAEKDVDLQEVVPDEHDCIRLVETVAFTDGTTPTLISSAVIIFGGGQTLPA